MDVTVVIPAYRSALLIGRAIQSSLSEGVAPHRIIVVEDGVADDTATVVARFPGTRLVSLPANRGAPHARNVGLSHVDTDKVMFLDADDYVESGLMRGLDAAIDRHAADVAVGPWQYHGEQRKRGRLHRPSPQSRPAWVLNWVNGQFFPPCCVMWKTNSVRAVGGWDEDLKKDQDGELMVRALTNGLSVAVCASGCGIYWQHASESRITRGVQSEHVLESAEVVYRHIRHWLATAEVPADVLRELGRYCCKMTWVALSYRQEDAAKLWQTRAFSYGYTEPAYSRATRVLATVLGVRHSASLKAQLRGRAFYHKTVAQR